MKKAIADWRENNLCADNIRKAMEAQAITDQQQKAVGRYQANTAKKLHEQAKELRFKEQKLSLEKHSHIEKENTSKIKAEKVKTASNASKQFKEEKHYEK